MTIEIEEEKKLSRRSFVAALFGMAAVIPAISLAPSDAEAQERQFTRFHHQPRVQRPRSPVRGRRRHRRVGRIQHTGSTKPHIDAPQ